MANTIYALGSAQNCLQERLTKEPEVQVTREALGKKIGEKIAKQLIGKYAAYISDPYHPVGKNKLLTYKIESGENSELESIVNQNISFYLTQISQLPGNESLKFEISGEKTTAPYSFPSMPGGGEQNQVLTGEFPAFMQLVASAAETSLQTDGKVGRGVIESALIKREEEFQKLQTTAEKVADTVIKKLIQDLSARINDLNQNIPGINHQALFTYRIPSLKGGVHFWPKISDEKDPFMRELVREFVQKKLDTFSALPGNERLVMNPEDSRENDWEYARVSISRGGETWALQPYEECVWGWVN